MTQGKRRAGAKVAIGEFFVARLVSGMVVCLLRARKEGRDCCCQGSIWRQRRKER